MKNLRSSEPVGQEEIVSSSLETLFRNLNSMRCASSFKSHPPSRLVWPQFLSLRCDNYVPEWWVEFDDELNSTMSWVGCLLKDSKLFFILVEENSQILLKISLILILLTFINLVALNLLVNNQFNSSSNSTHHCCT